MEISLNLIPNSLDNGAIVRSVCTQCALSETCSELDRKSGPNHHTEKTLLELQGALACLINYITGNAVRPIGEGNKIIVHICNDSGYWGTSLTMAFEHCWFKHHIMYTHLKMGCIDEFLELGTVVVVVNLLQC